MMIIFADNNEKKTEDIYFNWLVENYNYHHTASRRGYESRKSGGHAEPYKGRFGEGYVWISPRFDTTRYVDVTYFVK